MSSGPKAGRIMLAVIYPHVVIPWARQFTNSFAYFNPINPCSNLMRQVLLIILTLQRSKQTQRSYLPRVTKLVSNRMGIQTQGSRSW